MFVRNIVATVDGSVFVKPGQAPPTAAPVPAAPVEQVVEKHVDPEVSSLEGSLDLKVHDLEAAIESLGYHQKPTEDKVPS